MIVVDDKLKSLGGNSECIKRQFLLQYQFFYY